MMDKIYPELKDNKSSDNSKSEILHGEENSIINKYGSIPEIISKEDVIQLARHSGMLEADIELMKLWSENSLNAQSSALSALDIRVNHAAQSMKNEQQYNKKMSKHGKNIATHRLNNQVIQSNYDGFSIALNSANETIAI